MWAVSAQLQLCTQASLSFYVDEVGFYNIGDDPGLLMEPRRALHVCSLKASVVVSKQVGSGWSGDCVAVLFSEEVK